MLYRDLWKTLIKVRGSHVGAVGSEKAERQDLDEIAKENKGE